MGFPVSPASSARRGFMYLAVALLLAVPRIGAAQGTLSFFKNYFVTGDYVAAGVQLRGTGVNGFATGQITVAGVPASADILAAFLYWQTVQTEAHGTDADGAQFRGQDISPIARALNPSGTAPCWSSGGATGPSGGAHVMVSYRADVLRFLDIDPLSGKLQVNGAHQVRLPDVGSGGNGGVPSTGGVTLIIVYRDPAQPLRSIVFYDGGQTIDRGNRSFALTLKGFYQASVASPVAKMTHVVGDGQNNFSERLLFNSQQVALNPFIGPAWDTATFNVSTFMPAGAGQVTVNVVPDNKSIDCLSWSAVAFSTTVQDTDRDGLLDVWESSASTLLDPRGRQLPNLRSMGASPTVQDIFVEIGYMTTDGYNNPVQGAVGPHSHLPSKKALDLVATAFRNAGPRPTISGPINIHFDVGPNYQAPMVDPATGLPYPALPTAAQCLSNWQPSCAIIRAAVARGGESIVEKACVSTATVTCRFPDYPGTVGWKSAYKFYRDQPLNFPNEQQCVGADAACERRFDANRKDTFHYALFAHALGLPRGQEDDPATPFDERVTPKNTSGIADPPGGDLMVTLGFWDKHVGSDFMQASTLLHEIGHNLFLRHGGPPLVLQSGLTVLQANCRPNYQSVMNYLFQVRGLLTSVGNPVIDFSRQALPELDEQNLVEGAGMGPLAYRARWYAPWDSSFIDEALNTTPSDRRCDGTKLGPDEPAMARVDGQTVPTAGSPQIDWDADGVPDALVEQDINYSGPVDGQAFTVLAPGSNDFMTMDLRQVGGRRNVGSARIAGAMSLDMGFGDVGFGDVGFGDVGFGDVGFGDVGFGDVGFGDVGFGDVGFGDVGFGDVGAPLDDPDFEAGDVSLETAAALGNAPNSLTASVSTSALVLNWLPPHVGTVLTYELFRVTGTAVTPENLPTRVAIGGPTTLLKAADQTAVRGTTYTYFVFANLDDGTRTSVSNFATVTR